MTNLSLPLYVIFGGLAFGAGFLAGSALFAYALRQREQRVSRKIRALEAARLYFQRQGIELPAWVVRVVEDERLATVSRLRRQGIRRPVRWWHIRRWSK